MCAAKAAVLMEMHNGKDFMGEKPRAAATAGQHGEDLDRFGHPRSDAAE